MEIVLIRHGRPKIDTSGLVSPAEFGEWVLDYDKAGIDNEHRPIELVIHKALTCSFSVCSNLPRSIESARLLNISKPDVVSPLFRECEMPYSNLKFPKLPKVIWPLLFRLLQIIGCSENAESYQEMKRRSHDCTMQLISFAHDHGRVLFVGHGVLIWFVHKYLIDMGWDGPKKSPKNHWGVGEYSYNKV